MQHADASNFHIQSSAKSDSVRSGSVREWTGFTVVHVLLASIVRIVVSTGGVQVIGLGWYR